MTKKYHILNGDALLAQLPQTITGQRLVARECLVDGDVSGDTLALLFANRAHYLQTTYGESTNFYYREVVPQFEQMQTIKNADIYLWFEDDLFCQVNFWFVTHLLAESNNRLFLVRPQLHTPYGFGGLSQEELLELYTHSIILTQIAQIAQLWPIYQSNDLDKLLYTAQQLEDIYPFILPAVQAHIDRLPTNGSLGRPKEALMAICKELNTTEFGPVFREFNRRESIYGFGDLQVKRLLSL